MDEQRSSGMKDAKERIYRLQRAERRHEEWKNRQYEQEKTIARLERELAAEQEDVDKLMRMSLANLFHTLLRSKEEQLELERQQALAAALKLQEAKQALASVQAELQEIGRDLYTYRNAEREYNTLMEQKEASLRQLPEAEHSLVAMEEAIADQAVTAKELGEALTAGNRVLSSLLAASESLEKAENWGKWDMWGGGGMISTHKKHGHVDDARDHIQDANHYMKNFHEELADVNRSLQITIDISGAMKMADYWFDGFITDWIVQGRIQDSHDQTLDAIHTIQLVLEQLQAELASSESKLADLERRRAMWIEQS